jgi:hypothetical protein
MRGRRRCKPDIGDHHAAGVKASRSNRQADLPPVERDRQVGVHDGACDLSRRCIDPRGKINRNDGCRGGIHAVDQRGGRSRLAVKAGTDECIHDRVVAVELRCLLGDLPCFAKDARRDSSVATVRPSAADTGKAPRSGKCKHHLPRNCCAGAFHELRDRIRVPGVALLDRPHLSRRVERLEQLSHRRWD